MVDTELLALNPGQGFSLFIYEIVILTVMVNHSVLAYRRIRIARFYALNTVLDYHFSGTRNVELGYYRIGGRVGHLEECGVFTAIDNTTGVQFSDAYIGSRLSKN